MKPMSWTCRNCPAAWRTARRGRRPSKTPKMPSSSGSRLRKTTAWKFPNRADDWCSPDFQPDDHVERHLGEGLSLIHISEPTRLLSISYAVFCLKKKKNNIRLSQICTRVGTDFVKTYTGYGF